MEIHGSLDLAAPLGEDNAAPGSIRDRHSPLEAKGVIASAPLLAHRARDEYLRPAFGVVGRATLEQELCRTLQLRLGIEALAGPESLAAAECIDRRLAVGTAVLRRCAALARRYDPGIGQSDHCIGRILGGVARLSSQFVEGLLRTLHIRSELSRSLVQPTAERFNQVR